MKVLNQIASTFFTANKVVFTETQLYFALICYLGFLLFSESSYKLRFTTNLTLKYQFYFRITEMSTGPF